jgi:DNA-binding transcriptional MerR regulator
MPSPFTPPDQYDTTASGARTAGVSENTLRRKADRGEIQVIRTASGMRLYRRDDLLRLRDRLAQNTR